jgi:hypothetical protein
MKVAKLVYVTLATRVIVEEDADQQTIMELAVPRLSENLMDAPFENIDKIIDDTECPYEIGEEFYLSVGDNVEMPDPKDDGSDLWNNEFTGQIVNIYDTNSIIYVTVEDGEGECFDIEAERVTKI